MRFLLGIIVGVLITVGAAYIHDASVPEPAPITAAATDAAAPASGRMVNWAVVDSSMRGVNGWVRDQWAWITNQFNRAG